jgi:hypothetical protein
MSADPNTAASRTASADRLAGRGRLSMIVGDFDEIDL